MVKYNSKRNHPRIEPCGTPYFNIPALCLGTKIIRFFQEEIHDLKHQRLSDNLLISCWFASINSMFIKQGKTKSQVSQTKVLSGMVCSEA